MLPLKTLLASRIRTSTREKTVHIESVPKPVLDDSFTAIVTMTIASTATTQFSANVSHLWIIARRYAGRCELSSSLWFSAIAFSIHPKARNVAIPFIVSRKFVLSIDVSAYPTWHLSKSKPLTQELIGLTIEGFWPPDRVFEAAGSFSGKTSVLSRAP